MSRRPRREPYLTAQQVAKRLGCSSVMVLRVFRAGRIPGRRTAEGEVLFRWSEVVSAWDGERQLSFEDEAA
jgi:predicted site-specific integrase-resolvase